MTSRFKTKDMAKSTYLNYLKKAEECFTAAQSSLDKSDWNATAINAVHCGICASDAMCVYFLGKRHVGDDHGDAEKLFGSIKKSEDHSANVNRLARILRIKNMAEYEERLVRKSEADAIFRDMERFYEYVMKHLGQK